MIVTYGTLTINHVDPDTLKVTPVIEVTTQETHTGKVIGGIAPAYSFDIEMKARTTQHSDIVTLKSLQGTPYTLTIDGVAYAFCYITEINKQRLTYALWEYEIKFAQGDI